MIRASTPLVVAVPVNLAGVTSFGYGANPSVSSTTTVSAGVQPQGFVAVDGELGASYVWIRDARGDWRELVHGAPQPYEGDLLQLFAHDADRCPKARLLFSSSPEHLVRRQGNADEGLIGSETLDTFSLITGATGVLDVPTGAQVAGAVTMTPATDARYFTLDGSQGAAKIWYHDGTQWTPIEHGRPCPLRGSANKVYPHSTDRTSKIRILYSRQPFRIASRTGRSVTATLTAGGAWNTNGLTLEYDNNVDDPLDVSVRNAGGSLATIGLALVIDTGDGSNGNAALANLGTMAAGNRGAFHNPVAQGAGCISMFSDQTVTVRVTRGLPR